MTWDRAARISAYASLFSLGGCVAYLRIGDYERASANGLWTLVFLVAAILIDIHTQKEQK